MWSLTPSKTDTENSTCIEFEDEKNHVMKGSTVVLSWSATSDNK